MFNCRTNVDLNNRLICFDVQKLTKNLKQLGMLIVQDAVWSKVTINRNQHMKTWYYMDEFHLLLGEPETAQYTIDIFKRFRKWGGRPTAITQNVSDLFVTKSVQSIIKNINFVLMLSQSSDDREALAKMLSISPEQLNFVKNSGVGEGLIRCEGIILPFRDKFPDDTELYKVMTTKPEEVRAA